MYGLALKHVVCFCCNAAPRLLLMTIFLITITIVEPRSCWPLNPQDVESKLPRDLLQEKDEKLLSSRHENDCSDILGDVYQHLKVILTPLRGSKRSIWGHLAVLWYMMPCKFLVPLLEEGSVHSWWLLGPGWWWYRTWLSLGFYWISSSSS